MNQDQNDIIYRFLGTNDDAIFEDLKTSRDPLLTFTNFMNRELIDGALTLDDSDEISQIILTKPAMIRYKIYDKMLDDLEGGVDFDTVDYKEVIDTISREHQVIDTPFRHTIPIIATTSARNESGIIDIYVSRKQVPDFIMSDITFRSFTKTLGNTVGLDFDILCVQYDGGNQFDVFTCDIRSVDSPIAIKDIKSYLASSDLEIKKCVMAILKKIFLDCLLRRQTDRSFKQYVSLSLWNRSKNNLKFHKDNVDGAPNIDYFTLTYITRDPTKLLKGPTLITSSVSETKKQCNLVVGHGTTIGLDNRSFYHATPLADISQEKTMMRMPIEYYVGKPPLLQEQDHSRFIPSLIIDVANNTTNGERLFFRSWYYDTITTGNLTHITSIVLDKEMYDEMTVQRGIQHTDSASAEHLIDTLLETNVALGTRRRKSKKGKKSIKLIPFILGNNILKKKRRTIKKKPNKVFKFKTQ